MSERNPRREPGSPRGGTLSSEAVAVEANMVATNWSSAYQPTEAPFLPLAVSRSTRDAEVRLTADSAVFPIHCATLAESPIADDIPMRYSGAPSAENLPLHWDGDAGPQRFLPKV